jgi:hypothetical protein
MAFKKTLFFLFVLFQYTLTVEAQVSSDFTSNVDGWTVSDINFSDARVVTHNSSGGNPGGYASTAITSYSYWTSPSKFAGNRAYTSYGETLSFDMQINGTPTFHGPSYGDIMIRHASTFQMLVYTLPSYPANAPSWSTFTVTLDTNTPWRVGSTNGALATKTEIIDFLTNLQYIRINAQYGSTTTCGIDNIILSTRTFAAPPSILSFSPSSAKPGETVTITGTNFNTAANSVVTFGSVKAQILNTSATQIVVTVPDNATFGPITVTDIVSSLSDQSAKDFIPVFDEGGRIIRASFKDKVDITLNPSTSRLHFDVADIDGDGWNDLIAGEQSVNQVVVLRNRGLSGTITASSFETKVPLVMPRAGKMFVKAGDLDGDGKPDIVATSSDGFYARVGWFRNTSTSGNISFDPIEEIPTSSYSDGPIHLADIDGDGRPEIITVFDNSCGGAGSYVSVHQNMSSPGNIEFCFLKDVDFGFFCQAGYVTTGDLNNDGKPEMLVVGGFSNGLGIFENTSTPGIISFNAPFALTSTGSKSGVIVADFDADGKNDIAWNYFSLNHVKIVKNNYSGGSLDAASFGTEFILKSRLPSSHQYLTPADVNGDGKIDIVSFGGSDAAVFENISTAGVLDVNSLTTGVPIKAPGITYPNGPIVADLNGDGKPEIIGGTNSTPRIYIFENKNVHAPAISLNTVSPLAGPVGSTVTITGDHFSTTPAENHVYFGQVKATVLTSSKTQLTVSVPAGASYAPVSVTRDKLTSQYHLPFKVTFSSGATFDNTSFAPPVSFTLTGADYELDAGDLNGDGKPDIVAEGTLSKTHVFTNTHSTGVISASSLTANGALTNNSRNPKLVDADGDGQMDLITMDGVLQNTTSAGTITFGNSLFLPAAYQTKTFADFNRDGKLDLSGVNNINLTVIENWTNAPTFVSDGQYSSFSDEPVHLAKPSADGGSATGDFDRDGFDDIVSTNPPTDNMTIWKGTGAKMLTAASFTNVGNTTTGDNPKSIYAGDLDVDGKIDLVLYYGTGTSITSFTIFHNQSSVGNISFTRQDFIIGGNGGELAIGDLDGDGKPEIIVPSEATNVFRVFKNNSTAGTINASSFVSSPTYTAAAPRAVALVDINLDGKLDIALMSAPNSLLVFENLVAVAPTITINPQPTSTAVCNGDDATFTLSASGTTNITYQWQKFDGSVFNNISNTTGYTGTTTATLNINTTGNFGAGDYRCRVSGDDAADVFSIIVTLTVNSVPAAPTATGDSDCAPAAMTLTASGGSNGQYRWYDVLTGGSPIAGQTDNTYTTPVITTTTTFYAAINNGLCESQRTSVTATIAPLSKPAISFDPPIVTAGSTVNLCEGVQQSFVAPDGFAAYHWSNGETTQEVDIDQPGTYSVTVEDNEGCVSPPSDPVTVVISPFPIAELSVNGNILTSSIGDTYQWFYNGSLIPDATEQTLQFNVLEYGSYSVAVTENGCTTTSDDFIYLITALEPTRNGWSVSPNPFYSDLRIKAPENGDKDITIIDITGKEILQTTTNSGNILLGGLADGIYIMRIHIRNQVLHFRIIKDTYAK